MEDFRAAVAEHFQRRSHIAHGFDHVDRVATLARYIAGQEKYNVEEAEVAGLLHDIGRTVQEEEKGHGPAGVDLAKELLATYTNFDTLAVERIVKAVRDHSEFETEEELTQIIQDADKLDGLGAIGIMRAYTSKAHLPCYDPSTVMPNADERTMFIHGQIAFQMEWVGMMYTDTGKALAKKRYNTMLKHLTDFNAEALLQDI